MMDTNPQSQLGLSSEEAAKRLQQYGPNVLPSAKKRTLFTALLEIFREPMFLLLILATSVYLMFGERQEALFLTVFVGLIIVITLYQQGKAEHALKSLRELSSPRALVLRNGEEHRISGKEVVPGDVIYLNEGDRIPADGRLISANDLLVDESLLTGESFPIAKNMNSQDPGAVLVYSGTMVIQGQAIFCVLSTGTDTAIGKIGCKLQQLDIEISPLQKQITKLVKVFALLGLGASLLLALMLGILHHDWLKAGLSGIALAMTLLPEEFPVILTVFPALAAWRLSYNNVLTRRLAAIETLGSISILCTDKTGTITENRMKIAQYWLNALPQVEVTNAYLLTYAIYASEIQPFDPLEKAFHQAGSEMLAHYQELYHDRELIKEYDRTADLPIKAHIWQVQTQKNYKIAAKGAPETIINLCHLTLEEKNKVTQALMQMTGEGLRVLAIACGDFPVGEIFPENPVELPLRFLGLIGLADPIRANIKEAVKECQEAGVRVVMITGDHPITAQAIARQAGFSSQAVLIGTELDSMDEETLSDTIEDYQIYARISPDQKLRLVEILKARKCVVAMTGDGVNDAPALKAAHVGIAMGQRGTDVAREAASLVLTDDDFSSIVKAIRLGRRTYDNIIKSMSYILAVHVPIAGLALLPVMLGWPAMFYPMHIAFLQLIIDPACSIAFENEPAASDIMQRAPRDPNKALIEKSTLIYSLLQGIGVLFICLLTYHFSLQYLPEFQARTLTFTTLVIANILLIYANRADNISIFKAFLIYNPVIIYIMIFAMVFLCISIYLPFMAKLFQFSALPYPYLLLSLVLGLLSAVWFELLKFIKRSDIPHRL